MEGSDMLGTDFCLWSMSALCGLSGTERLSGWFLQEKGEAWWKVKVEVTQLFPTLSNPMDCTVHGILQARTLEWAAFPFSWGSSQPRDWTQVSRIAGRFFTSWATRKAWWCLLNTHRYSRLGLPRGLSVTESTCQCERHGLSPGLGRSSREGNVHLVFSLGKAHEQRNAVGCGPWGSQKNQT